MAILTLSNKTICNGYIDTIQQNNLQWQY